jgi:hypothetical protein
MDPARQRQAGSAPGRRGASGSVDAGRGAARAAAAAGVDASSGAAQAAAAASVDASSDAAQAAAAQAICRALRDRPALLDAVAHAVEAATNASAAAELKRVVSAGAESAPVGAETAAVLGVLSSFCGNKAGAARGAAAGLLPHVVELMRSPDPGVVLAAVALCWRAATADAAALSALAGEPNAAPALLARLRRGAAPPCYGDETGVKLPAMAAELLGLLARPDARAPAAAARRGGAPGGGSAVAAAVVAGGGVERMVALLRAALGGGGQILDASSARKLLAPLDIFVSTYPAAAAAARAAGLLPLAVRAVVEAQRTPGPNTTAVLCDGLVISCALAAAGDLPALAARSDLVGALAGAVALAADGAAGGRSAFEAGLLGRGASVCVGQLLAGGQGSSDAAAEHFLAAGGAAHLVRRTGARCRLGRARASGRGPAASVHACGASRVSRFGWAHCLATNYALAREPRPHPVQPNTPNHRTGAAPVQPRPMQPSVCGRPGRHPHPRGAPFRPPRPAGGRRGGRRPRRGRRHRRRVGGRRRPPGRSATSRRRPGESPPRAPGPHEPARRAAAGVAGGGGDQTGGGAPHVLGLRRGGAAGGRANPKVLRLRRPRALVQQGVPARELGGGAQGGVQGAAGRRAVTLMCSRCRCLYRLPAAAARLRRRRGPHTVAHALPLCKPPDCSEWSTVAPHWQAWTTGQRLMSNRACHVTEEEGPGVQGDSACECICACMGGREAPVSRSPLGKQGHRPTNKGDQPQAMHTWWALSALEKLGPQTGSAAALCVQETRVAGAGAATGGTAAVATGNSAAQTRARKRAHTQIT